MKFKDIRHNICWVLVLCGSSPAFAWGERGHHVICEVATRLVENKNLRDFLSSRGHMMGHLCNIPDIWWRSLGAEGKSGDYGHYINPDKLGLKIEELPLQYSDLFVMSFKTSEGLKAAEAINLPEFLGSLWWRGDQFYRRAIKAASGIEGLPLPTKEQQQNWNLPYNKAVFEMIESMGLMGHFVADSSMPYHADGDYDGWARGHGGIHGYYESASVDQLGLDLPAKVFQSAKAEKSFVKFKSDATLALRLMQEVSTLSHLDKAQIEKLDPIKKSKAIEATAVAELKPGSRVPPVREDSTVGAKKFAPYLVKEMARGAKALAILWDSIYERSGAPELAAYRSYHYPLKPDFVYPDYLPAESKK